MFRTVVICLLPCLVPLTAGVARGAAPGNVGSDTPPLTFEVMINGENFLVEANRRVKLKSQLKPGMTYDVAVQIALEQHVRLDRLEFDYEWPATVQETRRGARRSAEIRHELGFTFTVTDLGPALPPESQEQVLKLLVDSEADGLRDGGMKEVTPSKLIERKFTGATARGRAISYQDSKGITQASLVYLMTSPNFTASCVVHFSDNDKENVMPRVTKIFDSIRSLAAAPEK